MLQPLRWQARERKRGLPQKTQKEQATGSKQGFSFILFVIDWSCPVAVGHWTCIILMFLHRSVGMKGSLAVDGLSETSVWRP